MKKYLIFGFLILMFLNAEAKKKEKEAEEEEERSIAQTYYLIGFQYYRMGQYDRAILNIKKAIAE